MIGAIIVLELWFLYEDQYDDIDILEATYNLAMADIKTAIKEKNADTIIGMMIADGWTYKHNDEWYNFLARLEKSAKNLGIKKFYLVPGQCHEYQDELNKRNLDFEIVEFHWAVQEVKNNYLKNNRIEQIKQWNCNTEKFMFIGGFTARPKRIGMLSKLYDAGLLTNNAIWSFYPPWTAEDKKWCREYLHKYSDKEYKRFLKTADSYLDPMYKHSFKYTRMSGKELKDNNEFKKGWWKNVGYINNSFFNKTSVSIVNEGPGNDERFLTEKTWIPVINNHPFILVDSPTRFRYCKDIGLKMFEEYMLIPEYGFIEDNEKQMDAVVLNVQHFLKNASKNVELIKADIEHNKNVFCNIAEQNFRLVTDLEKNTGTVGVYKYLASRYLGNYNRIPKLSEIPTHKDE
jgi:hypothetical protein